MEKMDSCRCQCRLAFQVMVADLAGPVMNRIIGNHDITQPFSLICSDSNIPTIEKVEELKGAGADQVKGPQTVNELARTPGLALNAQPSKLSQFNIYRSRG